MSKKVDSASAMFKVYSEKVLTFSEYGINFNYA